MAETADVHRLLDDGGLLLQRPGLRPEVMRDFRLFLTSPFTGLFGGAAFDQVALLPVAASVDATGRFARNFSDRGVRSVLNVASLFIGTAHHRAEGASWLKTMHQEVHGKGVGDFAGVRYSALDPELWIWISMSGIRLVMKSFPVCTGHQPTAAEHEAMYQFLRHLTSDLELTSSAGKHPTSWPEFEQRYNDVATRRARPNPFIQKQYARLNQLPLPTLLLAPKLRAGLTPFHLVARRPAGNLIRLCSAHIMHPAVLRATGYRITRRRSIEFALIVKTIRILWRTLPTKLRTDPLTYERLRLEKLEFDGNIGPEYHKRRIQLEKRIDTVLQFGKRYRLETFGVPQHKDTGFCPATSQ